MLTQTDLQNIQKLFHREVVTSIQTELQVQLGPAIKKELDHQLGPAIKKELDHQLGPAIKKELDHQLGPAIKKELNHQLAPAIKAELAPIKKDIRKIKNDLALTIKFFDGEYMTAKNRLDRIEDHLHLPPIS